MLDVKLSGFDLRGLGLCSAHDEAVEAAVEEARGLVSCAYVENVRLVSAGTLIRA